MRARRWRFVLVACGALPVLCLSAAVSSNPGTFCVDGVLFPSEALSAGDASLVAERLRALGIEANSHEKAPVAPAAFADLLETARGTSSSSSPAVTVPRGFIAAHTFRSNTAGAPIDMALCAAGAAWPATTRGLVRAGWKCVIAKTGGGKILVGSRSDGKETSLLLLDETGKALFLRRTER